MDILNSYALESNNKIKINFNGGSLSSNAGFFSLLRSLLPKSVLLSWLKNYSEPMTLPSLDFIWMRIILCS